MIVIIDILFESETVQIDGKRFVSCSFVNCTLEYHGGNVVFDRTRMNGCTHLFFGHARQTLHYLQGVGLMPYNPADWGEPSSEVH